MALQARYHLRLAMLLAGACSLGSCSHSGCERVWSSAAVASPDHQWFAQVREYACSSGLGGWEEKDVELTSRTHPQDRVTVLTPTGQWTEPAQIELRWVSAHELRIVVPNRTNFDSPASQYKDVKIGVEYSPDDPVDRAKWREWQKRNDELVRKGEMPVEPPPAFPGRNQSSS